MVNQQGRFTPDLAEKVKQLRDLPSQRILWFWEEPQFKSFSLQKAELISTPIKFAADASSLYQGGVTWKNCNATWKLVAYVSRDVMPTCSNRDRDTHSFVSMQEIHVISFEHFLLDRPETIS